MSRILFIRHGQASFFGKTYDQLSELGQKQAAELAKFWEKTNIALNHIYAGNLERQKDSAQIAAARFLNHNSLNLLGHFNEHDGSKVVRSQKTTRLDPAANLEEKLAYLTNHMRIYEEVTRAWVKGEVETPAKCEDWQSFRTRVQEGFQTLLSKIGRGETLAVFTSGGPIAVAVGEVLGLPDEKIIEISWVIKNASVTEFLYSERGLSLNTFNTTPHLIDKELNTLV